MIEQTRWIWPGAHWRSPTRERRLRRRKKRTREKSNSHDDLAASDEPPWLVSRPEARLRFSSPWVRPTLRLCHIHPSAAASISSGRFRCCTFNWLLLLLSSASSRPH